MRETKDGIGFYVKGGFDGRREDEGREERTGQGVGAEVIMKLVLTIKGYDARTRRVGEWATRERALSTETGKE